MKKIILGLYGLLIICFSLGLLIPKTYAAETDSSSDSNPLNNQPVEIQAPREYHLYLSPNLHESRVFTFISRDIENIHPEGYEYIYSSYDNNQMKLTYYPTGTETTKGYVLVNTTELDESYDISALAFTDGDIYIITHRSLFNEESIRTQVISFLETLSLNTVNISETLQADNKFIHHHEIGTYELGTIYLKVEGNIGFIKSSETNPIVYENLGYQAYNVVKHTSDITFNEALNEVAKAGLFYNGQPIEEYTTDIIMGDKYSTINYYINEEPVLSTIIERTKSVDDFKNCIFADGPYGFALILNSRAKQEDVKAKYEYFIKDRYSSDNEYPFDYKIEDGLNEVETIVLGTYSNTVYRQFNATIKCNPIRPLEDETFFIQAQYRLKSFFTDFDNNKPLKVVSITLGSIMAAFLAVGAFKIFSKSYKWLRK